MYACRPVRRQWNLYRHKHKAAAAAFTIFKGKYQKNYIPENISAATVRVVHNSEIVLHLAQSIIILLQVLCII